MLGPDYGSPCLYCLPAPTPDKIKKREINSFTEDWGCQKVLFVPGSALGDLQKAAAPPDSPDAREDSSTSNEKESSHSFEVHVSKLQ